MSGSEYDEHEAPGPLRHSASARPAHGPDLERSGSGEHAAAPADTVARSSPRIRIGDRILTVGKTGEGKSELLAHLWAIYRGQRILIDVQDHYELGPVALEEGAIDVDRVADIDWRARTIRYAPRTLSKREFDDLFAAIYHRGDLFVWCDELEDPLPAHGAPTYARKVVKQGRKKRITFGGATQRPHGVERSAINQAETAFVFRMVDEDDIATLSYRLGLTTRQLADALRALPQHGYLRHTIGEPNIVQMPPLPAHVLAATRRHVVIP